jgi:hypothetical protein
MHCHRPLRGARAVSCILQRTTLKKLTKKLGNSEVGSDEASCPAQNAGLGIRGSARVLNSQSTALRMVLCLGNTRALRVVPDSASKESVYLLHSDSSPRRPGWVN